MRASPLVVPVLLLASLAAPGAAQAPGSVPDTFTLVGQVLDVEGDVPVNGAAVTIVELDRTTWTNYVGRFSFRGLTAGTWTFRVRHLGYEESEEASTVGPGALLRVRVASRPIELRGLTVSVASAERLLRDRRLKASTESSFRAWGPEELERAFEFSAVRFVEHRGLPFMPCPGDGGARMRRCWMVKGALGVVCVTLDDAPLAGGIEALDMRAPQEFHTVEVFRHLRQVRVYTRRYMEDLQERPRALVPVNFNGCYGAVGT